MKKLILASASPRRREILRDAGLVFTVSPSPYEEEYFEGLNPEALALTLSAHKAAPVARAHPDAVVLAADTLVILDDIILGKPASEAEARSMLSRLSGREHRVVTGFTVQTESGGKCISQSISTAVFFKELRDEVIAEYVSTGEPMDKAGAYGIQGLGGNLVERIEGDYLNVVGLPLDAVIEVLRNFEI